MLINNKNIRNAIDTLATKVVLILGSFSNDDKIILNLIKKQLSLSNYVPIIYDFAKPYTRNHTETVSTIAHLAKFIVADLTNQRSVPHELAKLIPNLRSVPIVPLIRDGQSPYGMFEDFKSENNVCPVLEYVSNDSIIELVQKLQTEAEKKIVSLYRN